MKRSILFAFTAFLLSAFAVEIAAQNLLANPGFEAPITSDGPPFVGSWEGFTGSPAANASNSTALPRTGAQHLSLSIAGTANSFAGVLQDVPVTPGIEYTLSGWNMTPSNPFDVGPEFRIEWRTATSEISRTANSIPILGATYTPFSLTATAPAGAQFARVVYAIQTFTSGALDTGTVYVDDMALVPEPSAIALLGITGLLLVAGRQWRRTRGS